ARPIAVGGSCPTRYAAAVCCTCGSTPSRSARGQWSWSASWRPQCAVRWRTEVPRQFPATSQRPGRSATFYGSITTWRIPMTSNDKQQPTGGAPTYSWTAPDSFSGHPGTYPHPDQARSDDSLVGAGQVGGNPAGANPAGANPAGAHPAASQLGGSQSGGSQSGGQGQHPGYGPSGQGQHPGYGPSAGGPGTPGTGGLGTPAGPGQPPAGPGQPPTGPTGPQYP